MKAAICQSRREASGRTGPAGPWVSDLQAPEPGEADPAGELRFRSPADACGIRTPFTCSISFSLATANPEVTLGPLIWSSPTGLVAQGCWD